jgi:hypothetical protein
MAMVMDPAPQIRLSRPLALKKTPLGDRSSIKLLDAPFEAVLDGPLRIAPAATAPYSMDRVAGTGPE